MYLYSDLEYRNDKRILKEKLENSSLSIIDTRIIKQLEKELNNINVKKPNYLVISYDVPSHFLKDLTKEEKRDLCNKRIKLISEFNIYGIRINNSTYLVPLYNVVRLIETFDMLYCNLNKKLLDRVSFKLIGNAYSDTIKDILKKVVSEMTDKIKKEILILEQKVNNKPSEKVKRKLYNLGFKIKMLYERICDLELVDNKNYEKLKDLLRKIDRDRLSLVDRCY